MGEKEVEDATVALRGLQINTCGAEIEMWISGRRAFTKFQNRILSFFCFFFLFLISMLQHRRNLGGFSKDELAECVGGALCQHAIEGGGGRQVAKLCGLLKEAHSVAALCRVRNLVFNTQYF